MTRMTIRGRRWPSAVLLGVAALAIGSVVGTARNGEAASAVAPSVTSPPTISGTLQVGQTLTATNGNWSGSTPITYAYQWLRCDENGGSCASINGATAKTYELKQADAGTTLRVRVTATNSDGSASSTSVPTGVVSAPAKTGCPAGDGPIKIEDLSAPARLLLDQQVLSPSLVTRDTNEITLQVRVTACGGRPVQGALVYAAAVPYNQFTVPAEVSSGADGRANLTMGKLRGFPATTQQRLLVMFLRARKANEDILAGVSTRRLVSFPVRLKG